MMVKTIGKNEKIDWFEIRIGGRAGARNFAGPTQQQSKLKSHVILACIELRYCDYDCYALCTSIVINIIMIVEW